MPSRSIRPWLTLITLAAAPPVVARAGPERIVADLTGGGFERWAFRTTAGGPGTKWTNGPEGLRVVLPASQDGRPPTGLEGRFTLGGDFSVVATYAINHLPRPATIPEGKQDWDVSSNIQLSLPGAPDQIILAYRNHRPSGEGVGFFASLPDQKSVSEHLPARGRTGRLAIMRRGAELNFLMGEEGGSLIELGKMPFHTGPIPKVALEAMARNTPEPIDVTFTRFEVEADRIDYDEPRPDQGGGTRTALVAVPALVLLVAGIVLWRTRNSLDRRPGGRAETGDGRRP